jgi:hypothetical protein
MNIAQLFDEFGVGEDVEVVVAALPELRTSALETLRRLVFNTFRVTAREWSLGSLTRRWTCSGIRTYPKTKS